MKFIATERALPGINPADFDKYAVEEAKNLWELNKSGFVREAYFTAEDHTAVLILEAPGLDEVKEKLANFPFVKQGLITFDVKTLVQYDGFERLMK